MSEILTHEMALTQGDSHKNAGIRRCQMLNAKCEMPGEIKIVEGEWRLMDGAGRGMILTANRREFTRLIYHPGTRKLTWTEWTLWTNTDVHRWTRKKPRGQNKDLRHPAENCPPYPATQIVRAARLPTVVRATRLLF